MTEKPARETFDLELFGTDETDLSGRWVDITFRGKTGRFKVARAGNDKFNKIYTRLRRQRVFADQDSEQSLEFDHNCMVEAIAEAVLIDTGDEIVIAGKPVKYTPALGVQILHKYPELRNRIAMAAGDFDKYATIKLEDQIKK